MQVQNSSQSVYLNPTKTKSKNNVSFRQAQANFFATGDNHGKIDPLPGFLDTITVNSDKIFPNKDDKGTKNYGIFNGDWYMNPGECGYLTQPDKNAGFFQRELFNAVITSIKTMVPNFRALYVPGNHGFDGGDKNLIDLLKNSDTTTVITNCDFDKSPIMQSLTPKEKEKIKQVEVLELPDDKNPNLVNKILVLGITQAGVDFYNPGLVNNLAIIDRTKKKDAQMKEEDFKTTYSVLNKIVSDFKEKNPNSVVMVMSHTGTPVSKMIARNVADIDVIFNGHDHKDEDSVEGKTHIISTGADSKKVDAVSIHFDDNGKWDGVSTTNKFYTKDSEPQPNNPLRPLLENFFSKDKQPIVQIACPLAATELSQHRKNPDGSIKVKDAVRVENNLLANFVNDGILSTIRTVEPDIQIWGCASSAFRQDLPVNKEGVNNFQLMNLLSGQTDSLSKIFTGDMNGSEVVEMVTENMRDHAKAPTRNTMVQWSGIQVNKSGYMEAVKDDTINDPAVTSQFVKIKDKDGKYQSINPNATYKVALPNYFFIRPKLPIIQNKIPARFSPVVRDNEVLTMKDAFRDYLKINHDKVCVSDYQAQEVRVI